jgi:isoquinoline 1-oxidoreductase alpha subunit
LVEKINKTCNMASISLKVNGKTRQVDVDPDTPLLWVLRDHLGLTGTKYACGISVCGVCTVHFNGAPIRACMMPVSAVGGGDIVTIEGLSEIGDHPVQLAWKEVDVPQCGFCQPGQIMMATALLRATPDPSDEDIDNTMSAVLCRCGTYVRIRKAIHLAAKKGGRI